MAKSDARFGYEAKLSRSDHDLSRQFGFTCAPGMLCPIFYDVATPGDTYYINHDLDFLRTRPLAAPAMIDVKVHYETFFVPMQMIYQPFENSEFSLSVIQSSNFTRSSLKNEQLPLFDYQTYKDDIISNAPVSTGRTEAFRLADFLGLNPLCMLPSTSTSYVGYSPSFFPYQILTYHTIFQYYYRLDDKSQFENFHSNWDSLYNVANTPFNPGYSTGFMRIWQRPWAFDYFTSMYRSPIVSDANLQSVISTGRYSNLVDLQYTTPIKSDGSQPSVNADYAAFSSGLNSTFVQNRVREAISTALIRQMFANEKLAMITGRTKKNYDSQVLAHYGVNVPHDVKHDLTLIGHDEYPLRVGEVTSLASTSDAPLGELAGKGYASGQGKKHKFTAPCHGVIMTIFSIEPMQRYYSGFDRINSVSTVYDLPIPEFDRLGNVPMYRYEIGHPLISTQTFADILGWKERYYQFKRRINRATVAFMPRLLRGGRIGYENDMRTYMIVNWPFNNASNTEESFYISVHAMDELMLYSFVYNWHVPQSETDEEDWNKYPHEVYARDPFIVNSFEKVKKVSWMSKDGEPIYPY